MIETALATDRRLTLSSICGYHRVRWVASEVERDQIREYAETLHFSKRSRPRCYGGLVLVRARASPQRVPQIRRDSFKTS